MRPRAIAWACVLLWAPSVLGAQTGSRIELRFAELPDYSPGIDSVFATLPGGDVQMTITSYDYASFGLGGFTLRLYFDPTRVSVVSARSSCPDSTTYPLTTSTGANYIELSATGCTVLAAYSHNVATLQLRLASGATDGSVLFLDPVSLESSTRASRTPDGQGDLAELCHALGIWGDLDADAKVNSRDALIALTNAVGLPTPGFFISRGDLDEDGQVTSRDALAMLSRSIGLPVFGFPRVGKGIADACAPQATLPRDLYFLRTRPSGGAAAPGSGFGLGVRAFLTTTVTVPGDSADAYPSYVWRPRVSLDETKVVFVCLHPFGYANVCVRNVASGTFTRFASFSYDVSPDWSPDGTQIVFVRGGQIWIMNADGTGATRARGDTTTTSFNPVSSVAWQPVANSHRIAYTISGSGAGGGVFTVAYDTVGTATRIVANAVSPCCPAYDATLVDWSPAGDSLAFDLYVDFVRVGAVAPNVPASTVVPRLSFVAAEARDVNWTDQGLLFAYKPFFTISNFRIYLQRPGGEVVRLSPLTATQDRYPGMKRQ